MESYKLLSQELIFPNYSHIFREIEFNSYIWSNSQLWHNIFSLIRFVADKVDKFAKLTSKVNQAVLSGFIALNSQKSQTTNATCSEILFTQIKKWGKEWVIVQWISPRTACVHFVTKFFPKNPLLENMFPKTILGCLGRLRWKESIGRWQKGQNCQYRSRRMQNMSQKIVKIKATRKIGD